jgi:hypothetical protein
MSLHICVHTYKKKFWTQYSVKCLKELSGEGRPQFVEVVLTDGVRVLVYVYMYAGIYSCIYVCVCLCGMCYQEKATEQSE